MGISIQSLELRLWRIDVKDKKDKNKSDNTRTKSEESAKKNAAIGLDMAEAKLLSRLMIELDKS